MTDTQKYRMRLIHVHMDYITAEINDVDSMIKKLISPDPDYENAVRLLCIIPGVKYNSAVTIISEIGVNMSQFCTSKCLCCWVGLTPSSNETGGKKKSIRICVPEYTIYWLSSTFFHTKPPLFRIKTQGKQRFFSIFLDFFTHFDET